ncbi:hypothetical protein EUX98_g9780 [Antrodiella citrinella]|uniref:Uncharacterized protein n=1 Tax=Antrodiella citrinella TaxID=2447956 RepID=A0A4S4LL89_9APHY|nr:hypothetical protein EUX98_g9780 [Antrodiella citrinella]
MVPGLLEPVTGNSEVTVQEVQAAMEAQEMLLRSRGCVVWGTARPSMVANKSAVQSPPNGNDRSVCPATIANESSHSSNIAQPLSDESDASSSTAADESSTVTTPEERLHPNGKPLIKIREVSEVYDHDEYIPLRYFRRVHNLDESKHVTRDTLVTVAQVEQAEEAYRDAPSTDSLTADQLRAILYAVDMQWDSLSQKGDGREESNCHYGVE